MIRRSLALVVLLASWPAMAQPTEPDANYVRQHAHALPPLGRLPDELGPELAPYRALMFGEVHGTREAPRLALELARLLERGGRAAWLGLEIPMTEQAALDRFRATGDVGILKEMPFFRRPVETQDGRSSRALAEMLMAVQKLPEIATYCIDPGVAGSMQDRDTGMAHEVARRLAERPGTVAVTLTGSLHASQKVGTPWDPRYRPMGYELAHLLSPPGKALSVEFHYESGMAWTREAPTNGLPVSGLHVLGPNHDMFSNAVLWGAYFLTLPTPIDGFGAILFWRIPSASPPLLYISSSPAPTPMPPPTPVPTPTPLKR